MNVRRKILAVDDSEINLEVMEEILADKYELLTATSGEEALEVMEREQPDLVLLDIMMPGIDGYETCRRIRTSPNVRDTMIILVSAKAFLSERLLGYEAGANDYLTKPFNEAELLAKVKVFLRLKSAEEIDALKTNLLTLFDHEIRTPLTGIIPAGQLLCADGEMGTEERQMWGQMVLENGERLLDLAKRGILLCRMRDRSVTLDLKKVDLIQKFRSATEQAARIHKASIRWMECEATSLVVEADEELLDACLRSLLEGAIKYGEPTRELSVVVALNDEYVDLKIEITHTDVGTEDLEGLLEPLGPRRVDGEVVGSDIALPFARAVLRAHGGTLKALRMGDKDITLSAGLPLRANVATTLVED